MDSGLEEEELAAALKANETPLNSAAAGRDTAGLEEEIPPRLRDLLDLWIQQTGRAPEDLMGMTLADMIRLPPYADIPRPRQIAELPDELFGGSDTAEAGLEEKAQGAASRPARIEHQVSELGGVRGMAPSQLADLSRRLRELASSREDVDVAMRAQQTRISHGTELRPPALNAVESSGGVWTRPDGAAPVVFVFEGSQQAWAPFVAKAGAPVGVIADTLWRAEGMREMFKELGVPERQFRVVSLDVEGDRSRAWQTIQGHFSLPGFPAPQPITFSGDSSAAEIEQILRGYGFNFQNSPTPRLREVDLYLSSRA